MGPSDDGETDPKLNLPHLSRLLADFVRLVEKSIPTVAIIIRVTILRYYPSKVAIHDILLLRSISCCDTGSSHRNYRSTEMRKQFERYDMTIVDCLRLRGC